VRQLVIILVVASVLAACGGAQTSPSPAVPSAAVKATSTVSQASASPNLILSPSSAPTSVPPTPTPKLVTGLFSVSRDRITMSVEPESMSYVDGRLQLSVTWTGLTPGEAVSVVSTGEYQIGWACPQFEGETKGSDEATASALVGSDGVGVLQVELVAVPPDECSTDPATSKQTLGGACWDGIEVTDAVHALRVTRETACTGP
jgi:hypothetical protein